MSGRLSLFDVLKEGGYEACLVSTFSLDFGFYEDVMLRRMSTAGVRHHLLFVDAGMCQQALANRAPQKLGFQYSLLPMVCNGAFHPKVLLLLGKNKGLMAVGSHNLTLSGFGQNLEITNVVRYGRDQPEQAGLFAEAFRGFQSWLADYGAAVPASIAEGLDKTLSLCPWLEKALATNNTAAEARFLFSSAATPPLWQQVQPILPTAIDQVVASAPFFDQKLAFLSVLEQRSNSPPLIGIQPDQVNAPRWRWLKTHDLQWST